MDIEGTFTKEDLYAAIAMHAILSRTDIVTHHDIETMDVTSMNKVVVASYQQADLMINKDNVV